MVTNAPAGTGTAPETEARHVVFWRSLYWRTGVSLVLFMIAMVVAQTMLLTYRMRAEAADVRRSPNIIAMVSSGIRLLQLPVVVPVPPVPAELDVVSVATVVGEVGVSPPQPTN